MRWLIVEDALQDSRGHWFEYARVFHNELIRLGDGVEILVSKKAESRIIQKLNARAILPDSIWHKLDQQTLLARIISVPLHSFRTWLALSKVLKKDCNYDIIFIPTVSVHHLLAWFVLILTILRKNPARILLYFVSIPMIVDEDGNAQWVKSPNTFILRLLLALLRPYVKSGKIILGVETAFQQQALSSAAKIMVRYIPQPVESPSFESSPKAGAELLFACYGPARCEKGSDILQSAIGIYFKLNPDSRLKFAIQWIDDFRSETGQIATKSQDLQNDPRVEYIGHYFGDREYDQWLDRTAVMLLPYRLASYKLRGSRVAIEAMTRGIPIVTTFGTALAEQSKKYGAAVLFENNDVEDLVNAIRQADENFKELKIVAQQRKQFAQTHFSVANFREILNQI